MRPIVHHIPICPFCQRLEILLALKGASDAIDFAVVDVTQPRDPRLLELTGGTTALPVLELDGGRALKESMVLLEYLEDALPDVPVRQDDPYRRAVEALLATMAGPLIDAGYTLVLNQDRSRRDALITAYHDQYRALDRFLRRHATPGSDFLFDDFGWAETVFTPFFQRFFFVRYYEGVDLPEGDDCARVRAWHDACVAHPAAQQTTEEEIVKLYYDYAKGVGNGGALPGRTRSSFVLDPPASARPMPPRDKYGHDATDAELGLL